MNKILKYSYSILVMILAVVCITSCADDKLDSNAGQGKGLLNIHIGSISSRLAELPSVDKMFEDNDGLKEIGLYIYYTEDYKKGDLSKPYMRNLKCTKGAGNTLVTTENIYIYDKMTLVAFYPYNEEMNDTRNYFKVPNDENAYYITRSDYSKQKYIPYRAQTEVNPTNAYLVQLNFSPKQTCKIEVVLVSSDVNKFPKYVTINDGKIKMIPSVDPYTEEDWDNTRPNPDRRENWLDKIDIFNETGGGKNVRRYTTYIWKSANEETPHHDQYTHDDNKVEAGDILFESDELTLYMPRALDYAQETVYRYGYNLDSGEIFIPTSDNLVYDAATLKAGNNAYQVCDIDLTSITWEPKNLYNGSFDGGGHAIKNMNYSITPTANKSAQDIDKQSYGFFGTISGTSSIKNINLVNPKIIVDSSGMPAKKDTCFVGALCGLVNPGLSEAQKRLLLYNSLPSELSEVVKQALVQEQLADFGSTTSKITGCRVINPQITVTGDMVRVGGVIGGAGNQEQKAEIKDSYVTAASSTEGFIKVNELQASRSSYENVYVGGFVGMADNCNIKQCFSAVKTLNGYKKVVNGGVVSSIDKAYGFAATHASNKWSLSNNYTSTADKGSTTAAQATLFSASFPSWSLFTAGGVSNGFNNGTTKWPAFSWDNSWNDNGVNGAYPTLIWEHQLIVEYR